MMEQLSLFDDRTAVGKPASRDPLVIRNAPTGLMKKLHYGEGYQYAHQTEDKIAAMQCMPDSLRDRRYYVPTEEGNEKAAKKRLEEVKAWRDAHGMGI